MEDATQNVVFAVPKKLSAASSCQERGLLGDNPARHFTYQDQNIFNGIDVDNDINFSSRL